MDAAIGVLMLDTKLYRPRGDIGNKETFSFPVRYEMIKGATLDKIIKEQDKSFIDSFVKGAKKLEKAGVKAITTSCGFSALFHKEIEKEIDVLFFSSSLMQIPFVYELIGSKGIVGVLTASKADLTEEHFLNIGIEDIPIAIEGMDDMPEFNRTIMNEQRDMNINIMNDEVVYKAKQLSNNKEVKAIVLECTNMPPYANSIRKATKLPVFDIVTLTNYIYWSI